ncbi:peptide ABC transporter substrate-binding protein [Pigmentibacter sp. JX0631]|uniref:peptide ABC transporter substrate-binding protein n=1 Tax=Pigmentibacter sp. JX0631 TaxID=2976982 RepID=UPI00246898A8|nr:peptide ABC transporter substrate-binding protein [Pigmentibacter sp. JX0631]WGL59062.1 peptide ABC transporter substrate-binding protein [Pigmentibacter sp. JX0631]
MQKTSHFIKFIRYLKTIIFCFMICNFNFVAVAQKVVLRDELTRFSGGKPITFDPTNTNDKPTEQILQDMFEGLTRIDRNGKVIMAIAESYRVEDNNKTYIFKIRSNAKWSDGTQVTAEHCALPIKRLMNPNISTIVGFSAFPILNSKKVFEGKLSQKFLGVQVINPRTLLLKLEHPFPHFLELLSSINYVCLHPRSYDKNGKFIEHFPTMSNSAYQIQSYEEDKYIILEKNPYFYNKDKVQINKVTYFFMEDILSQINMYLTGQANITSANISSEDLPYLENKLVDNQIQFNPSNDSVLLLVNTSIEPFKNNVKLRKAISLVIDRSDLAKRVLSKPEFKIFDIVPYNIEDYKVYIPDWAFWTYEKRILEAKKLMKEAGYEKKRLSLKLKYNYYPDNHKIALGIAEMLEKNLNITLTLEKQEIKNNIQDVRKGNYQLSINKFYPNYIDAIEYLSILKSKHKENHTFMNDKTFDALLDKASQENDYNVRNKLLQKAAKKGLENYTIIPMLNYISKYLINYDLMGYTNEDSYVKLYSQDLYFKKMIIPQ